MDLEMATSHLHVGKHTRTYKVNFAKVVNVKENKIIDNLLLIFRATDHFDSMSYVRKSPCRYVLLCPRLPSKQLSIKTPDKDKFLVKSPRMGLTPRRID
jgi:hypothetical protein